MPNNKLVSVYIPTHNRAELLKVAVASVLNQDHPKIEIIIVDDHSTDNTQQVLAELANKHSNIKHLKLGNHQRGACHARNMAINIALGSFITGLDDDDVFTPTRISELIKLYDPNYSFICTTNASHQKGTTIPARSLKFKNAASNQFFTETKRVQEIGGFDTEMTMLQDWEVFIRLIKRYGPAKRVRSVTYIHNEDPGRQRISTKGQYKQMFKKLQDKHADIYSREDILFSDRYVNYLTQKKTLLEFILSIKPCEAIRFTRWYISIKTPNSIR